MTAQRKIGIALSGGGSRAIAFHLGCLRALHDLGLLRQASVMSTVSGGSVIGALYAMSDGSFPEFEARVRQLLRSGLFWPSLRAAVTTPEGAKIITSFVLSGAIRLLTVPAAWMASALQLVFSDKSKRQQPWLTGQSTIRRFASRTTLLRHVLNTQVFSRRRLADLQSDRPRLVVIATELRTGAAFYFGARHSGCWRYGQVASGDVTLADAVAASAAYPLLLPALDEIMAFERRDGTRVEERVILADGGVYDNLALSPLWPGRDPAVSIGVEDVDTVICCRAGYAVRHDPPSGFFISRLKSAFLAMHERNQNAAMTRLFELKAAGRIEAFVVPYLGQRDDRMKYRSPNLVSRDDAYGYPTNFFAMSDAWIDKLSTRGEQITHALIREHAPHLLSTNGGSASI